MSSEAEFFTLDLGGIALEAARWGRGAPEIVLLHEGLGSVGLWRDFPARLAAATGRGVFAYSRAGYGHSASIPLPRPLSYMHDEARETLPRILAQEAARRVILLGHSDGASIAAIHAGAAAGGTTAIAGLVLIAPHFFVEDISLASIAAAREAYRAGDLRRRLARHHRDVDAAFRGWNDAWLDPGFRDWRIDDVLPAIAAPVLLIQGEADEYGTMAQIRLAEAKLPRPPRVVIVPAAGHSPHLSHPERVIAAIGAFVAAALTSDE
ncbi:MAG: alpha/beta hydrolase [Acidibrevibacterium sp.]|uniref:alpha/beta fold hydrolase n=1 Tax=Acidibrevibacterium fodinaquatile TaxID=1969806 RepID=UPI0023A7BB94|nr:alpha/beta hydrolase [Acidibrevibacterium fodinaquatile]MCA7117984.1 alpha/beta hydrolase [Acidibrevibacterium fodinaquatile]